MGRQNRKLLENIAKLDAKKKSSVRRQVDLDLGVKPPSSAIHTSKKVYNRKLKHKNHAEEKEIK